MRSTLESKYALIWEKYSNSPFAEILSRGHAFHHDHDEEGSDLLFIGINPSFTDGIKENGVFDRSAQHSYFKPFQTIHNELMGKVRTEKYNKWTHIDILAFRETSQKYVRTILSEDNGVRFIWEQVMLAKERILHIKPRVIVVCNTMARELMGKESTGEKGVWMGFEFDFNDEFGSYIVKDVPELKHTHVLFSSMLSGQRALDLGSRERLVWQIKRILKSD